MDLPAELNRLAGTDGLGPALAANILAGTAGLELVGALNAYVNAHGLEMNAALKLIAQELGGDRTLDGPGALGSVPSSPWPDPEIEGAAEFVLTGTTRKADGQGGDGIVYASDVVTKGVQIENFRNVIVRDMTVKIDADWVSEGWNKADIKGINVKDCTGHIRIENVRFTGDTIGDGVYVNCPTGPTVEIVNVRHDLAHGKDDDSGAFEHGDVVQVFRLGGGTLRIYKLTGYTEYQGLYIRDEGTGGAKADIRRVDIHGVTGPNDSARWLLALYNSFASVNLFDVWLDYSGNHANHNSLANCVRPQAGHQDWQTPGFTSSYTKDDGYGRELVRFDGVTTPAVRGVVFGGPRPDGENVAA